MGDDELPPLVRVLVAPLLAVHPRELRVAVVLDELHPSPPLGVQQRRRRVQEVGDPGDTSAGSILGLELHAGAQRVAVHDGGEVVAVAAGRVEGTKLLEHSALRLGDADAGVDLRLCHEPAVQRVA